MGWIWRKQQSAERGVPTSDIVSDPASVGGRHKEHGGRQDEMQDGMAMAG